MGFMQLNGANAMAIINIGVDSIQLAGGSCEGSRGTVHHGCGQPVLRCSVSTKLIFMRMLAYGVC
jgi:hypothetical protein